MMRIIRKIQDIAAIVVLLIFVGLFIALAAGAFGPPPKVSDVECRFSKAGGCD